MTDQERMERLKSLREQVTKYASVERARLVSEREFLKDVLNRSLGPVQDKKNKALADVLVDLQKYMATE